MRKYKNKLQVHKKNFYSYLIKINFVILQQLTFAKSLRDKAKNNLLIKKKKK